MGRPWTPPHVTLLLSSALFATGCTRPPAPFVNPLLAAAEIRRMEALYFDRDAGGVVERIRFEVPPDRWESLLSALLPAQEDASEPTIPTYTALGSLDITLANGQPFWMGLFWTPAGQAGAFAAGQTPVARRYYRGGTTGQLQAALREARRAVGEEKVLEEAEPEQGSSPGSGSSRSPGARTSPDGCPGQPG